MALRAASERHPGLPLQRRQVLRTDALQVGRLRVCGMTAATHGGPASALATTAPSTTHGRIGRVEAVDAADLPPGAPG